MLWKQKLGATAIHFFGSLVIFSFFTLILLFFWFPEPYFSASGGQQGIIIVALIDVVLGPILTFIVFNLKKPRQELIRDLGIIILLQLAALFYGIYTVYGQRPVAVVFWENKFFTVPAKELTGQFSGNIKLQEILAKPALPFVYVQRPQTAEEHKELIDTVQQTRVPPHHQIDKFSPIDSHFDEIKKHSIDIKEILAHNSEMDQKLKKILMDTQTSLENNIYIVLESKYQNIILVFDQGGKQLGYIKAPFKEL